MRKNLFYAGVVLLIFGIIFMAFAIMNAAAGLSLPQIVPTQTSLFINSSDIGFVSMPLNESGMIYAAFNSTYPVDFYLANASVFSAIEHAGAANMSARSVAASLEGKGVYEVYEGSAEGAFPPGLINYTAPKYLLNLTSLLTNGIYYAVFANFGNKTAFVYLRYVTPNETAIMTVSNANTSRLAYVAAAFLVICAAVVVIVASFVIKGKQKQQPQDTIDEQAKKEYERIEKENKKK